MSHTLLQCLFAERHDHVCEYVYVTIIGTFVCTVPKLEYCKREKFGRGGNLERSLVPYCSAL